MINWPKRRVPKRPSHNRQAESAEQPQSWWQRTGAWFKSYSRIGIIGAAMVSGITGMTSGAIIAQQEYIAANTNEVYHVYIGDEKAGTVSDPEIIEEYLQSKQEKLNENDEGIHMVLRYDPLSYKNEKGFKLESDDQDVLERLDKAVYAKAAGVELYVNEQLIGVVKDQETADKILDSIEEKYTPKPSGKVSVLSSAASIAATTDSSGTTSSTVSTQTGKLKSVEFVEDVKLQQVDAEPEQIKDAEEIKELLQSSQSDPLVYTVQSGDCLNCIAEKFDVTLEFIYERNEWIKDDFLQIGDKIDLTVEEPLLNVKTVEQVEKIEAVDYSTVYENDDTMRVGTSKEKQAGQEGKKRVIMNVTKLNGGLLTEEKIDEEVVVQPVPRIVLQGTKVIRGIGTGSFSWPVSRPNITSSYGARWGTTHKGLDMTSNSGNLTIRAADNGKVVKASYSRGYGYHVIIDHQNGYRTLYAHMSKITTKKGSLLEKGDKIGVMGTTGQSTGVHLHFEVHKNGRIQNPANYLN